MNIATRIIAPIFAIGLALPAAAGGLNPPVETGGPTPPPAGPGPVSYGADWSGAYVGGSLGFGDLEATAAFGDAFDGNTLGVHAGYNMDFGSFVVGGELEYSAADINDAVTGQDLDSVLRAKLRLGYDAGSFMPFLSVGAARASTSGPLGDLESTGSFYGFGADFRVAEAVTVGAEFLRHEFDDFDGTGIDIEADTMSLRVSYEF